jgi:micrococcal nuclease
MVGRRRFEIGGLTARWVAGAGAALCLSLTLGACSNQRPTIIVQRVDDSVVASPTTVGPSPAEWVGEGPVEANATMKRPVDGDTIVVTLIAEDGSEANEETVRLIGIDTPETKKPNTPVQCFGPEASNALASALQPGDRVRLELDVEERDRYGRLLAYVYRADDGLFVNLALAEYGYAAVATFPPNVTHTDEFVTAVRTAREQGRGLWSACGSQ